MLGILTKGLGQALFAQTNNITERLTTNSAIHPAIQSTKMAEVYFLSFTASGICKHFRNIEALRKKKMGGKRKRKKESENANPAMETHVQFKQLTIAQKLRKHTKKVATQIVCSVSVITLKLEVKLWLYCAGCHTPQNQQRNQRKMASAPKHQQWRCTVHFHCLSVFNL